MKNISYWKIDVSKWKKIIQLGSTYGRKIFIVFNMEWEIKKKKMSQSNVSFSSIIYSKRNIYMKFSTNRINVNLSLIFQLL